MTVRTQQRLKLVLVAAGLALGIQLAGAPRAAAHPPPAGAQQVGPGAASSRPRFGKRFAAGVRRASQRTASLFNRIHRKTPAVVRHGAAAIITGAVAVASFDSLMQTDIATVKGVLSATGVVLGSSSTAHQTWATIRSAWPGRARRVALHAAGVQRLLAARVPG